MFRVLKNYGTNNNNEERKSVKFVVYHNCENNRIPDKIEKKDEINADDYSIDIDPAAENSIGSINDINESRFNEENEAMNNINYPQISNNLRDDQINCKFI